MSVVRLCKDAAVNFELAYPTGAPPKLDVERHVLIVPPPEGGSMTQPFVLDVRHRLAGVQPCAALAAPSPTRTCEQLEHWEIALASRRAFSPSDRHKLRTILGDEADSERDPAEPIFSNRAVLIRVEGQAPWLFIPALIDQCASVGLYRVELALSQRDGEGRSAAARGPSGVRPLVTRYVAGQVLRISRRTEIVLATSASNVVQAGRPVEAGSADQERNAAWLREVVRDEVMSVAEGVPTVVNRSFETLDGGWTQRRGENESHGALDSPLQAVALAVAAGEGHSARVRRLDSGLEVALPHQLPGLALDELLPPFEVALGEPWPLHDPQVARALGTDAWLELFPELTSDEWRRHTAVGSLSTLAGAEWHGEAKLVALDRTVSASKCTEIDFVLEYRGEVPDSEDPAWGALRNATFRNRLEGQAWFAAELQRPVALEARGTVLNEFDRELQDGTGGHFSMEGTLHFRVEVANAP
jgi:hypothetical protein